MKVEEPLAGAPIRIQGRAQVVLRAGMNPIRVKRVYEKPEESDGVRILVDRLWPRGLSKKEAAVDLWLKELAPSNELRLRFHHDRDRWPEFRREYLEELRGKADLLGQARSRRAGGPVTLLYAARDTERNNAVVLREALDTDH